MYKALKNGQLFFSSEIGLDNYKLSEAKLDLQRGSSGTFTFTITPENTEYGNFHRLTDYIDVCRDEKIIWSGRVFSVSEGMYKTQKIVCEGLLSVLNDSIFRPILFDGQLHDLVRAILDSHNSQVEAEKQINAGIFTVDNSEVYRAFQNYETSISRLQDLVDSFGGWLSIRKHNGSLYLDWYASSIRSSTQSIDFGQNLIDITKAQNAEGIFTVLIPLGATDDEGKKLDIKSVNDGLDYITAPSEYIQKYGYIVGTRVWPDVNVPSILLSKGRKALEAAVTPRLTINVTAVDMSNVNAEIESFEIGESIPVFSEVHGLSGEAFDCTKQSLNLLHPAQDKMQLGTEKVGYLKVARADQAAVSRTLEQIVAQYATKTFLEIAQENLTQILTGNQGGFKVERDTNGDGFIDEVLFMDTTDVETARNVWRINQSGWGHSSNGIDGPYTMGASLDDSFVAKFITAGYLNADLIRTGIIRGQTGGTYWNLNTGELHLEGQFNVDKSKVFIREPTVPYYEGDLWITGREDNSAVAGYAIAGQAIAGTEGSSTGLGTILTCIYTRTTGDFTPADWKVVTEYIDADAIDQLEKRIQAAELNISAQDAKIEAKASSTVVNAMGLRIDNVELDLSGQDAKIEALASSVRTVADKSKTFREQPVPPYEEGDTWITGTEEYSSVAGSAVAGDAIAGWGKDLFVATRSRAEGEDFNRDDWILATKYVGEEEIYTLKEQIQNAQVTIDAANARIDLKADSSTVSALYTRVNKAEIAIDGANARIDLKASTESVTALERRVRSAEIDIDAANTQIALRATKTDLNAVSGRVTSAESQITINAEKIESKVSKNGGEIVSLITQDASNVKILASSINLQGALTISALTNSTKANILKNATVKTQFYMSTSATSTSGGSWSDSVPVWSSGKYVWTRTATTKTNADGTTSTTYSGAVYDQNLTMALSTAETAKLTANTANSRVTAHYGTCSSAASAVEKTVTLSGFNLYNGAQITVYFANSNTAASPTLNVNGTGAKPIYVKNTNLSAAYNWQAKDTVSFTYNGQAWVMSESSANAVLANWCYQNNKTYIDGGNIYAGTVSANQIAANAITAGKIAANAITTGKLAAQAVTAAKININDLFSQNITATNFNLKGGSINIETSSETQNKIQLSYQDSKLLLSPVSLQVYVRGTKRFQFFNGMLWGYDKSGATSFVLDSNEGKFFLKQDLFKILQKSFTGRLYADSEKVYWIEGTVDIKPDEGYEIVGLGGFYAEAFVADGTWSTPGKAYLINVYRACLTKNTDGTAKLWYGFSNTGATTWDVRFYYYIMESFVKAPL